MDQTPWQIDVGNTSYDESTGAISMIMKRKNPGIEEVKVGAAVFVGMRFKDNDGMIVDGGYFKWAEEA